jgi:hypothetical protein
MPTSNATGIPIKRGSIGTGWIRTSTPAHRQEHDLQMLGPVIKARRLPPAAGPTYRALRQSIGRRDQIHQHEQWHHHAQRRQPNAKQLRADHRHLDGFDVRQIAIAHDGVRNGKRRALRKPQPHVVDPRHPKHQPIQKVRRSGHGTRHPALPLREFDPARKVGSQDAFQSADTLRPDLEHKAQSTIQATTTIPTKPSSNTKPIFSGASSAPATTPS